MSDLHVRQIRAFLEKHFTSFIDLKDVALRSKEDQTNHFLTRALAALSLHYIANITIKDAALAVTDGADDNGIDALYYHQSDRILFLCQSKYHHDGTATIDRGSLQKYIKGFKDILNARWERFGALVSNQSSILDKALDDASTRIVLLITYTGQDSVSTEVKQDIEDLLQEINDTSELVTFKVLRQSDNYTAIAHGTEGIPIDLDVVLYDWGQVREPYSAFYGQVSASDIANWVNLHHNKLLTPNIRMFLGSTEVNETILKTLKESPEDFWYFNNGITVLCRTIRKKPIGGSTRENGIFECHDLRIVNGAQTAGSIADAYLKEPEKVGKARVPIRLISLEDTPADFDKSVTKFNNTQNRIDPRDFVALDPEQERIKGELLLEGITYVYKSGDTVPPGSPGFDITEATVARACINDDLALTTQAKRGIGLLWNDIEKAPYKILFNQSVNGLELWRGVQILRKVESWLTSMRPSLTGRDRLLSVHGNRFMTHIIIHKLGKQFVKQMAAISAEEEKTINNLLEQEFINVLEVLNRLYPDAYLHMLFKNSSKCSLIKSELL